MKEKIKEIKKIEERRLRAFPLYKQTEFKIFNTLVYVKLERERKPEEPTTIIKKIAQIIWDTEKENLNPSLFNTLEGSIKSYNRTYFVLKGNMIQKEFQSPDLIDFLRSRKALLSGDSFNFVEYHAQDDFELKLNVIENKLDPCQQCRFWKKLSETGWNQTKCVLLGIFEPEDNNMFPCGYFETKEVL